MRPQCPGDDIEIVEIVEPGKDVVGARSRSDEPACIDWGPQPSSREPSGAGGVAQATAGLLRAEGAASRAGTGRRLKCGVVWRVPAGGSVTVRRTLHRITATILREVVAMDALVTLRLC